MTDPIAIVALGASNTAGWGVLAHEAYPAVLENSLRARGITARVHNAGVSGQTTAEMLSRLDRDVPDGTRIVIFQPGSNDQRLGIDEAERSRNIATITNWLSARSIRVLRVGRIFDAVKPGNVQPDGIHLTTAGHTRVAEMLMADVVAALG